MAKLYVFGIGGTGSRVLRSLTMLLASGVDCHVDTIVPIIIDRDKGNGDFTRTDDLIRKYISVNKIAPKEDEAKNIKNRFFKTEIKLLSNELLLKLDDETKIFEEFIGLPSMDAIPESKALLQMLFSNNTLKMDTEHGFRGNPNIGSIVLNQFEDKNIFKTFAGDFQDGDKIFIISSIFGGTGASGFPLLRKMLHTPNLNDADGNELPHWGLINNSPIGAISVLPYFNVDKKDDVDSDTFNDKTRAALSYYESENGKIDTLYYIADNNRKAYKYATGGKDQINDAHFVELCAAMSILDFVNKDKKSINFQKDGNGKRKTIYKEFGINSNVPEISFANLAGETQKLLVNPLSRFLLFTKYMGYTIVKEQENGKDNFIAKNVKSNNIFSKENKYQPYASRRFRHDFRKNITNLETIQKLFLAWLQEMTQQNRKFTPFNLETPDAFIFVNGNINIFHKSDFRYKNWAAVDNELNKQISKTNSSLNENTGEMFLELFYRATEVLINQTSQNDGEGKDKYIFRLQQEGDHGLVNTIKHWDISNIYGEKARNAIKSSNAHSEKQPTSIPSPFARIALVKTAFNEVGAYGENALKAYQKIVSDTLDIAEIFFKYDKWKKEISIVKWYMGEMEMEMGKYKIKELPGGSDLQRLSGYKILHKTLKTFLLNDAETYNFNKMQSIYILKHNNTGEMIGATSPSTLFLSSANTFSNIVLPLGDRNAFVGLKPLHKRDWNFQEYLYTWFTANNENRYVGDKEISIFPEFKSYLDSQKKISVNNGRSDLDFETKPEKARTFLSSNYIQLTGVEILGKPSYRAKSVEDNTVTWQEPKKDNSGEIEDINLTVDHFLEEKIIQLPGIINSDYFTIKHKNNNGKSVLLPLKDKFFDIYPMISGEELKSMVEIDGDERIIVTLTIDENGKKIPFQKVYTKTNNSIASFPDSANFMLFPNVNFVKETDAHYRAGLFFSNSEKTQTDKYSLDFYNGNKKLELADAEKPIIRNSDDNVNSICKTYSLNQKKFNRIKITIHGVSGILLPKLPSKGSSEEFTFAVDLGTTNTHIEYKTTTNQNTRPFDIEENEKQLSFLLESDDKTHPNALVADIDFIPNKIGKDELFKFPVRTALSLQKELESNKIIHPFTHANIIIPYEKRKVPDYNRIITQLKWDSSVEEMGYFIDSLCYILRNKVLLKGGSLDKTKIVWFYPLSMAGQRSNEIADVWRNSYAKYFFGSSKGFNDLEDKEKDALNKKIVQLPESIAPFLLYKEIEPIKSAMDGLVSIDIGGGTTDIVFIKDKTPKYATSFRFAANSIFGLGENITPIISKYKPTIEKIILDQGRENGAKYNYLFDNIYRGITGDTEKGDIASFFFALKKHEMLQDSTIDLDAMLKADKEQKLVLVLFYSAIIYHTAKIMKAKELNLPRHIVFSGNGSRIVNIVSNKEVLTELTKYIFEKVFSEKYDSSGLDIIQNTKNPKEVTCQGGIKAADKDIKIKWEPVYLLGIDDDTFIKDTDTYTTINTDECVNKTKEQVKQFFSYVLNDLLVNQKFTGGVIDEKLVDALKINKQALEIAGNELAKDGDLIRFTRNGINDKINSIRPAALAKTKIEETFFFYPIASLLNVISAKINTILK